MSKDYIEVDWYLCGVYQGKRKVGKNSIAGKILSGDFFGALQGSGNMKQDLEKLGCASTAQPNNPVGADGTSSGFTQGSLFNQS